MQLHPPSVLATLHSLRGAWLTYRGVGARVRGRPGAVHGRFGPRVVTPTVGTIIGVRVAQTAGAAMVIHASLVGLSAFALGRRATGLAAVVAALGSTGAVCSSRPLAGSA